jgi:hypothetical protein
MFLKRRQVSALWVCNHNLSDVTQLNAPQPCASFAAKQWCYISRILFWGQLSRKSWHKMFRGWAAKGVGAGGAALSRISAPVVRFASRQYTWALGLPPPLWASTAARTHTPLLCNPSDTHVEPDSLNKHVRSLHFIFLVMAASSWHTCSLVFGRVDVRITSVVQVWFYIPRRIIF